MKEKTKSKTDFRELDLYAEDFDSESIWNAVCDAVGVDGFTANHIVINYNFATAVNVVDYKEKEDD